MKKNLLLLTVFAAITSGTITSCSKNDDATPTPAPEDRAEVRFSSNIITSVIKSRAAGTTWADNDSIGVYMFEAEADNIIDANVKYVNTVNSGTFAPSGNKIYFPDNGDEARFMAYYPYSATVTGNVYSVSVAEQTSQPEIDLLYVFNENGYGKWTEDKLVPLAFEHQLTKIIVNVKAGDGLEAGDLNDLIISITGMNTVAKFNLINGELADLEEKKQIVLLEAAPENGYVYGAEAIVIPTDNVDNVKLFFDLNNSDDENNDTFAWSFTEELEKGTMYTYNVTISRSGLAVKATIEDWIDKDPESIIAE